MKIHRGLQEFTPLPHAVVTQGTFDGVHLGHREILKKVVEMARHRNAESVMVTFFPHPRLVLYPDDNTLKLITSLEEKARMIEACGIDHIIVLPFTREFSRFSALEFIRDVLVEAIGMKTLVIGYDHRFGKNREGGIEDAKYLAKVYDYEVIEIPAQDIEHSIISSTKIRKALLEGDIETANKFLGYPFIMKGRVIHGRGQGKTLGYPTANLMIEDPYKLIPGNGIYIALVKVFGRWNPAMMSIGNNPTFKDVSWSVEVNVLDFEEDLYDEVLNIKMLKRIRNEIKFDSIEALKAQLSADSAETLQYFKRLGEAQNDGI
jgi:riboflavin kinase/FMN adenylyltransferase